MTEPGPALTAATLVLAAVAIAFALTTALRHNDVAGRLWSSANIAFLCVLGVATARAHDAGPTLALEATAVGALVAGTGLLWCGLRSFAGDLPRPAAPLLVAAVLVAARLVPDSVLPDASVEGVGLVAAAVLAALGSATLRRGPMARNLHVLVLRVVLALMAAVLVVAAVMRVSGREQTPVAHVALVMLVAVTLQCLVAMRVERQGSWWSSDVADERSTLDVLTREQFLYSAQDRLERLGLVGGEAALVVTGVEDLDAVNDAFGRDVGDQVLLTMSRVIRAHVPPWAVAGHLGAGTFAILTPIEQAGGGADVAEGIERGLVGLRRDDAESVPVAASSGHADTFSSSADLQALIAAATRGRTTDAP